MIRHCCHRWFLITALTTGASALGQTAGAPTLLEQLSQQTEALYHHVSRGVVRVQLPLERAAALPAGAADPLAPWSDKLSPDIRARLEQSRASGTMYVAEILRDPQTTVAAPRKIIVFSPNVLGFVVDEDGHALLPMYVSAADVGGARPPVTLCDGSHTEERFVGSDLKTNLTVVQLPHAAVRPLALSPATLQEGALVMIMSMDPSATRLGVWTRWSSNSGLIVAADGAVAGFSEHGRFLDGAMLAPMVHEIILHGSVHRPRLGVAIHEVGPDDPQRVMFPALADIPAIRIIKVLPNSPATRAQLRPGDLILTLAGQAVGDGPSFAAAITAAKRGPTKLQILRQDEVISVIVDLEADLPG